MQISSSQQNEAKSIQKIQQNEKLYSFKKFIQEKQIVIFEMIKKIVKKDIGYGHMTYPIKLTKRLKQIDGKKVQVEQIEQKLWSYVKQKINSRVQKLQQSKQKQYQLVILSDLIVYMIPNFCSYYLAIHNYIKKWSEMENIEAISPDKNKRVSQERPSSTQSIQIKQEQVQFKALNGPLKEIRKFFKSFEMIKGYYEAKEKQFQKILVKQKDQVNQQSKKLNYLITLSKLQQNEIENRIKQAQKILSQIDKGQTLDPQVYKNRLILNQYISPDKQQWHNVFQAKKLKLIYRMKKRAKKAEKKLNQRDRFVYELIDKQKLYVNTLNIYIEHVKRPIQALGVLSEQQKRALFCNIEQIKGIHEILYQKLKKRYQTHHKYQFYGDIYKEIIPFFKMYVDYEYILTAQAPKLMIKLNEENQQIRQICHKFFILTYKKASDEINQPHQKILSYSLYFKQIIDYTNPQHKDHKLFTEALAILQKNLSAVQQTVNKLSKTNRTYQIDQQFGTPQHPIFKNNRILIDQFSCSMIRDDKTIKTIIFCFNDLILIVEEHTRKKLKYIIVDEKFYVRREEDNKVYKNMIKVHSKEGFLTLTTGDQIISFQIANKLFDSLKTIQTKTENNQLVYIHVLGTQEIGSTSFAKYTEYIIEIKYMSLKKLLHLRFSQVSQIVKDMQNYYKNQLSITQEQTLRKTWFNNHKSKTIQDRKRIIEQILQKLFNHELVRKDPTYLLAHLNLPQKFFQTARKISAQRDSKELFISSFEKIESLGLGDSVKWSKKNSLSRKQLKEAVTILCATEIKLGRDIYHDMDQQQQNKKEKAEKIQIYINTMKQDEEIMVRVTEYDTVQDVCNKVSKLIGLRENRDFRLFHQIGKKQLRVLEHEQLILKIFTFPKNTKRESVQGFFQSMTSSIKKVISPDTHPTLIFKKYIYLPIEIQQRQAKRDLTRLRLLTYQIFFQIKDRKYQLNFEEYLSFCALFIYVQTDGEFDKEQIDSKIIHKIIPQTIFKLKNYSQEQWIMKVRPYMLKFKQQINKVVQFNKLQVKNKKMVSETQSKISLLLGHRHLASQIVLGKIKQNSVYGSNLFYVQPYKKTYEELKNQGNIKMAYNMWLAVKVDSLSLLTPTTKQSQFQLKYDQIQNTTVYSQAIVFKTLDHINKTYRFNTYQSFEISQLFKYYKVLNEMLKQLNENEALASKVRQYRQQVINYRSSMYHQDGEI